MTDLELQPMRPSDTFGFLSRLFTWQVSALRKREIGGKSWGGGRLAMGADRLVLKGL